MIFLDANFFLRYLVQPSPGDPNGQANQVIATALFAAIDHGEEEATTTEVVLHEVCYVLASKRHYNLPPADIATYLAPILRMPGLKLARGEKRLYLRALDIYVAHPVLEFADTVVAARCERLGVPLATFDERLGRLPFLTRWRPPAGSAAP
jgi:predicted nucleic acid-binding protein